jgi:hypothetical protein
VRAANPHSLTDNLLVINSSNFQFSPPRSLSLWERGRVRAAGAKPTSGPGNCATDLRRVLCVPVVAVLNKLSPAWILGRRDSSQVDLCLWGECCIGKIGKEWSKGLGIRGTMDDGLKILLSPLSSLPCFLPPSYSKGWHNFKSEPARGCSRAYRENCSETFSTLTGSS